MFFYCAMCMPGACGAQNTSDALKPESWVIVSLCGSWELNLDLLEQLMPLTTDLFQHKLFKVQFT